MHRPRSPRVRHCRQVRWGCLAALAACTLAAAAPAVDQSSPKATAKSFIAATDRADAQAIRQLMIVKDDDGGHQLLEAYAQVLISSKRLSAAAAARYPGVVDPLTKKALATEDAAEIDSGAESIDGEAATLTFARTDRPPMRFHRTGADGGWQVVIDALPLRPATNASDSVPGKASQLGLIRGLAQAMQQTADEIGADRYPTVNEARAALKERLGAVLAKAFLTASSRPATTQAAR